MSEKFRVMIIGTGGMARLFTRILKRKVSALAVASRYPGKAKALSKRMKVKWALIEDVDKFNTIIFTTPSKHLPEMVEKVSENLMKGSLVMDITSVKMGIVDAVKNKLPNYVEYISLHPLFGPATRNHRKCRIAVIPIRDAGSLNRVVNLFKRIGLNVVVTAPEEHDALMAFIQVAHHVTYLSLALALWESVDPKLLGKYSTRSLRQTALMFKSLHRNFKVIKEIQESNIYGDLARRKLIECINKLGSDDREAWKNVEKALKKLPQAILP